MPRQGHLVPLTQVADADTDTAVSRDVALDIRDLSVFRGSLPAVRGTSFQVKRGDALGVLGRNGAGKTTLLAGIMGNLPIKGKIFLSGEDVTNARAWKRARAGLALIPQGRLLLPDLTVQENLRVAELEKPGNGPEFDIHELFPALRQLFKRKAGYLSGGEQQQVAIARGLLRRPSMLLLDEPTEGLAPAIVAEIGRVLERLIQAGLTLVLAEQHHHIVASLCSHFLVLRSGEVAGYAETNPSAINSYYNL
jgi:ABC-type branched-subunit amino acid transport system ATPase component